MYDFSANHNSIDKFDVLNIQKYLKIKNRVTKKVFVALLSFSKSLPTKYVSLNNEPCVTRSFPIDLNHVELKNYPFMISLDKCNGSCNSINLLSMRICVLSKTKQVNVKVVKIIRIIKEAKTLAKHFSCDCKLKFSSKT